MIKKPGTPEAALERIGAPERTPQPARNPSFVPAAVAARQVPLGLRRPTTLAPLAPGVVMWIGDERDAAVWQTLAGAPDPEAES